MRQCCVALLYFGFWPRSWSLRRLLPAPAATGILPTVGTELVRARCRWRVSRSACGKLVSPFLENLVHHRNRDRSFPNRRRNTLHIARPYIPYGKHSRKTGFEQIRSTRQRPLCGRQIDRNQVYARLDESPFIERQTACKPARVRVPLNSR